MIIKKFQGKTENEAIEVARKELGEMPSSNPNIKDQVVLEKFVDSKYVGSGNLEDAWTSLSNGELTFDSFLLAMVDIVDALTLGVFKPQLLEIKINPHIKAREVVYRAEVAYDTPTEETVNSVSEDCSQKQETIKTQRRITTLKLNSFQINILLTIHIFWLRCCLEKILMKITHSSKKELL